MFKEGVQYLAGGVESGFTKVDREAFTTRLLHIKGRRNIRVAQTKLEPQSLNDGDVFILDAGRQIFQWNGAEASRVEKQKGLVVTKRIRDQERSGKAAIHIIDNGKDDDSAFWTAFGVEKPRKIKSAKEGGDDQTHSRKSAENTKLYHVSDASGSIAVNELTERPFKKEHLKTDDAYILDVAGTAIYAWIGKGASEQEKLHSMKIATDFLKSKGYPNWTPVTRVVEGAETPLFKENFQNWPEKDASKPGASGARKSAFVKRTSEFDAKSLHQKKAREQAKMPDDGSGELEVWRVEDFELVEVPKKMYGQFFGGDSYVLKYTYLVNGKENYIIYFWQGLESSQDEKGASALWAVKKDDELGGAAVQVRVVQNKEPPHFYVMFKGKMVVHAGGKASGFKNAGDTDSYDTDGTRLFQVRGTTKENVRAIQVTEKADFLNSGDAFILESPKGNWLWFGKGCTGDEREAAKEIAKIVLTKECEILMEGSEPAGFWEALGGKVDYPDHAAVSDENFHEPRLFQCSNATGNFEVEEIFDFDQEDLIPEDVMLLDTYNEVFVWVGEEANAVEKKESLKTAMAYVESDTSGRTLDDTVLLQIKQGCEPPNFTCHFFAWNPKKWSDGKTYAELKAEMEASNPSGGAAALEGTSVTAALDKYSASHPYSELIKPADQLPEGVDPTQREQYLSDAEFEQYFKMSKTEFNAMPKWKAAGLKKKVKLF
jgi:hypothetical protein